MKTCALPGCEKSMKVGDAPYVLSGFPGIEYCSRACVGAAWEAQRKKRPKSEYVASEEDMNKPAPEFGDSGVVRKFCDRPGCRNAVSLSWKGRHGEFCSNACYKLAENASSLKEEETEMTDATATTPVADKPITAGTVPAKKNAKKTAAKKVAPAAKKAAAKAAPTNGTRSKFADDAVIRVLKTDHGLRGGRAEALDAMKDGMTVEKFRAALAKKGDGYVGTYFNWALKTGVEMKLISVKS